MKATLFALFVALLMVGCGESPTPSDHSDSSTTTEVPESPKTIDLDDNKTRYKIIAEAINWDNLQKRGTKGEELYYAPSDQTPYTGWAKTMHDNGQIWSLIQMKNGKLDGLGSSWHDNGQKEWEATFKDGKESGPFTIWYENGNKSDEMHFSEGKQDGPYARWYMTGQMRFQGVYSKGLLITDAGWKPDGQRNKTHVVDGTGMSFRYYENGQKQEEVFFKDGKLLTYLVWKPNGEKCPFTDVVNGSGSLVYYNEDGTEKFRSTFNDGEIVED